MKVAELIERLREANPEANVITFREGCDSLGGCPGYPGGEESLIGVYILSDYKVSLEFSD